MKKESFVEDYEPDDDEARDQFAEECINYVECLIIRVNEARARYWWT